MSSLENSVIKKKMEVDRNHIDSFVMETDEGTKRTKEKFYREASEDRNSYIEKEIAFYETCRSTMIGEIRKRFPMRSPQDKTNEYANDLLHEDKLLDLVCLDSTLPNSFKLKLDYIVSSITDDTSLEELNKILEDFIQQLLGYSIPLTIEDFKYTMFTEQYMEVFLQKPDFALLKESFEKIYFTCPTIKLQLKMNLEDILRRYDKELEKAVLSLKEKALKEYQVDPSKVIETYVNYRNQLGSKIAQDEFYNTQLFLDSKLKIDDYLEASALRSKNYNLFAMNGSYIDLGDDEKNRYNNEMMNLYVTLNELKKYYRYEPILKKLLEIYKNKDSAKNSFATKQKEIDKEEGTRQGIYKEYQKACGVGFLARKNDTKRKNAMLKMNEQVTKIHTLREEMEEIHMAYILSQLDESASIYDVFLASLHEFSFFEDNFRGEEVYQEKSLVENFNEFLRFLFNPNNSILRKINVFTDYNITDIVAEKYKLLNLNLTSEMIGSETMDATLDSVRFINLIQNIEKSHISLKEIKVLCRFREILATANDSEEEKTEEK